MKKILGVGATLLVGVFAAACGSEDAAGPSPDPAAVERGRVLFEQVSLSVYGSAEDRLAVERDDAALFQGALASCMGAAGFAYHRAPSEGQNGGPLTFGDFESITEIGEDFGIATAKRNQAVVADELHAAARPMTAEQGAAYGKALSGCSSVASEKQQQGASRRGRTPVGPTAIFSEVEKQPAVTEALAAYRPCMGVAGFEAKSYSAVYQQVLDGFPRADLGWVSMQQDPQWHAAVEFEKRAARADAKCRRPAQDLAFAAAADRLEQFVTENRVELDAARAQWAALRD